MSKTERTIVGYGASTMQGVGDSLGGFFGRVERTLLPVHPDWRFINMGIGGNTSREMLARIGDVDACCPFTSIVILGCNDLPRDGDTDPARRTTIEEYGHNLAGFLPKLAGEGSIFISSFPPNAVTRGVQMTTMERYLGEATRQAKKLGFVAWDLLAEMKNNPALPGYWAADGMHFNDAGHAFLAKRVVELMKDL